MKHASMKAIFHIAVCCGFVILSTTACDSEPNHAEGLKTNCENSGGTFVDALCVCGQTFCPAGVVCKDGACEKTAFDLLCEASGGESEANRCKCSGTICDDGLVCNTNTKECPKSQPTGFCNSEDVFCTNSRMYTCGENHTWVEGEKCKVACYDKKKCADCMADVCKDGELFKCVDGEIASQSVKCKSNECTEDGTKCKDLCKKGEVSCFDHKVQKCQNNSWIPVKDCHAGCADDGKSCATTCKDNTTQCADGWIKTCKGDKYDDGTACDHGASCKSVTECGECKDGTIECNEGKIKTCNKGVWSDAVACKNNFSCKSKTECGECINSNIVCKNDETTQVGHLENCVDGKIVRGDDCKYENINYSCKGGRTLRPCLNAENASTRS